MDVDAVGERGTDRERDDLGPVRPVTGGVAPVGPTGVRP